MWITLFVTFLVAVLSGLGVGSAGLLVVWLTLVEGLPQLAAQALNLVFFLSASGGALAVHILRTPLLWGCILLLLPGGFLGCFAGTGLALVLPRIWLQRVFGLLLIAAGALGLFSSRG